MIYFAKSHEWVKVEGNVGIVGISDYAQKELGEIVFVQLPKVGQKVQAGKEVCVLESTKAASDVYSPVSGTIIAVNDSLKKTPASINNSAMSDGWLFQIELSHPQETAKLLSHEEYREIIT